VYGIECAGIAEHAKQIVKENGYENIVEIIHGKVEEIELPVEQVDVIISEWMGYFLLYESMLNTVLYARDKWLAPNGVLMPDRSRLYFGAIEDADYMQEKIYFWENVYGFKMSCLKEEAIKEPLVDVVHAKSLVTDCQRVLEIDLYKVTQDELNFESDFELQVRCDDYVHALVAYFDVEFSRCHTRIGFTTAPFAEYTHWKQTVFYLDRPMMVTKGTKIKCHVEVKRNAKNHRDLDITVSTKYLSQKMGKLEQTRMYYMR
jgi:protein arginine N-methyltransferase 1